MSTLATKIANLALNEHAKADVDDTNLHYPKGFLAGLGGTNAFKDNSGNIVWQQSGKLEAALNEVDGLSAPPTDVNGDVYILDKASVVYDIDTIVFQSGTTSRITLNGTPDLSSLVVGDHVRIRLAANASNNGTFITTAINDGSDFIEYTNAARTNSDDDEASDTPATATTTHRDWDEVGDTDHVVFFDEFGKWFGVTPNLGNLVFNIASDAERIFKTTGWVATTGAGDGNIYDNDGTLSGTRIVSMGTNNLTFGSTGESSLLHIDNTNDRIGFGQGAPTARAHFKGDATSITFAAKFDNSADSPLLHIRNDGRLSVNLAIESTAIFYIKGNSGTDILRTDRSTGVRTFTVNDNGNIFPFGHDIVDLGQLLINKSSSVFSSDIIDIDITSTGTTAPDATNSYLSTRNTSNTDGNYMFHNFQNEDEKALAASGLQVTNHATFKADFVWRTSDGVANVTTEKMRLTDTGNLILERNVDGDHITMSHKNSKANVVSETNHTVLEKYFIGGFESARITVGQLADYVVAGDRDSFYAISTMDGGALSEQVRIDNVGDFDLINGVYKAGGVAGVSFGPSAVTSITVVNGIVTAIS